MVDSVTSVYLLPSLAASSDYTPFSCDNRTVNKHEMCHGYGLCQDGTDLEQCSALGCDPDNEVSCGTNTNNGHRECYQTKKGNDGSYDCLSRRDEKIISRDTSVSIDFTELKKCYINLSNSPVDGLTCGSDCVGSTNWCVKEKSRSCETENSSFNTASKEICRNATIWREKNITCDHFGFSNKFHGVRCDGNNQKCIFPHYTAPSISVSLFLIPSLPKRCEDRSDQVFRAGLTCWNIALDHVKTYCDTFCTDERIDHQEEWVKRECQEKCDDPSAWLSNQTDPYILDPHLCQDSCQTPGLHCEACSNEMYPRCRKNNVTVCYHPELWCDGHPVCDNADEDEPITNETCYQILLRRGEEYKSGRFLFPFYSIFIRTTKSYLLNTIVMASLTLLRNT